MKPAVLALALGVTLTLGGCMTPPGAPPPSSTCNAANASFVIGQPATEANMEAARAAAGATIVRTLRPGQVVTMEYAEGRLNLRVNSANIVTEVTCG
jgi:hypothetical protein